MSKEQKLNILLITSDQQHWNTLGFANKELFDSEPGQTRPRGHTLYESVLHESDVHAVQGLYYNGAVSSQHGAWSLGTKLSEDIPTIGDSLSRAGFRTALVGKRIFSRLRARTSIRHLSHIRSCRTWTFGGNFTGRFTGSITLSWLETTRTKPTWASTTLTGLKIMAGDNWRDYFRTPTGNNDSQKRKWLIPERFHYDAWIAERTNALTGAGRSKRRAFFLVGEASSTLILSILAPEPWDTMYDPEKITVPSATPGEHEHNPPHFGLTQQADPDFLAWRESGMANHGLHSHLINRKELAADIAVYYGMISLMDKYVGAILDKLGSLGLAENTLVVFTTDHGHFFGQHGLIAKGPFHYEDMIQSSVFSETSGRSAVGAKQRCTSKPGGPVSNVPKHAGR